MEYRLYLKSIVDDSVIVRDDIICVNTKNVETLKMERNDFKKLILEIADINISMLLRKFDCCKTFTYFVG